MKKFLVLTVASMLLVGCNEALDENLDDLDENTEDNSNENPDGDVTGASTELGVTFKKPTLVIDDSNLEAVNNLTIEIATTWYSLSDSVETYDSLRSFHSPSLNNIEPKAAGPSIEETSVRECDSGTETWETTASGVDAGSGEVQAEGNFIYSFSYDNCRDGTDSYYTLEDGKTTTELSWSGFDSAAEEASFWELTIIRDDLHGISYDEYGTESGEIDGIMKAVGDLAEYRKSFAFSLSTYQIDNETITMETTADIVEGNSDSYPSSGSFRVKGASDTRVDYLIVPNGIEVSINGGQATLMTWSDIEADN